MVAVHSARRVEVDPGVTPGVMTYRYQHHGLRLGSTIELPELDSRRLVEGTPYDVSIAHGRVSIDRDDETDGSVVLRGVNGSALFSYSNLGRFLVTDGREVTADLLADADPVLIRSCLLTVVTAMLCHQRGLFVLHASAVAFDGQAAAFAGDSGAGKSTLAAHCVQAGARLLADDMLVVSFAEDGSLLAHPGTSVLKLKTYALESLGRTSAGLVQETPDEDKFLVPSEACFATKPLPLRRVHILDEDDAAGSGRCERLTGAAALAALVDNSFAVRYLDAIGRRDAHFALCCRLAAKAEVARLSRRRDAAQLPATATMIRNMLSRSDSRS